MKEQQGGKYQFDNFCVDLANRQLRRDNEPVPIPRKAFDLLVALVESGGRLIEKDELFRSVWQDQIVEESNLTVHISEIRKALAETKKNPRYIETVPGYGYRFIGDVSIPRNGHATANGESVVPESEIFMSPADPAAGSLTPNGGGALDKPDISTGEKPPLKKTPLGKQTSPVFYAAAVIPFLLVTAGILYWFAGPVKSGAKTDPFLNSRVRQLTTKGQIRWMSISPDAAFYAYILTERNGANQSLWLSQTDGTREIQLRPPDQIVYQALAFSPDGKSILFTISSDEPSKAGLFKMPVLGGLAERVSPTVNVPFSLSPDGKQIAFFRHENDAVTLVTANVDGTNENALSTRSLPDTFATRSPVWSPDGSMLATVVVTDPAKESREIFVARVADGHFEKLTSFEWSRVSNLSWQPDGTGLILVATSKGKTLRHLWQARYPGGDVRRLSRDTDSYGAALSISADGNFLAAVQIRQESNLWISPAEDLSSARQATFSSVNGTYGWNGLDWTPSGGIVFTGGVDRSVALFAMDADGGHLRQITSGGFFDQKPSVTPDGKFVIFQSNRSGGTEIWRLQTENGDLRQLTFGGGSSPDASPDSQWVVYEAPSDGITSIWRIGIEGGKPIRVSDKRTSDPRISPSGQMIACGYTADDKAALKLAILNIEDGNLIKLFDFPKNGDLNIGIRWTPDGRSVIFRDRVSGVWQQNIEGGPPQKLKGLPDGPLLNFSWSDDGKHFAYARGRSISDAVLISESK